MEIGMTFLRVKNNDGLQWGHNFFVMEINQVIQSSNCIPWLQWGHNFFVMEITSLITDEVARIEASMGP